MKLFILKTNIQTEAKVESIRSVFNSHPVIMNWSVDTEDIDNVLRIEGTDELREEDIIDSLKKYGFYGEELLD